ncbi:NELlike 1 (Silurana), partial [Caligus rogercresseyi]
ISCFPQKNQFTASTLRKIVTNNKIIRKPSAILGYFHERFSEILGGERQRFPKKRRSHKGEVYTLENIVNYIKKDYKDSKAAGPDGICGRLFSLVPEEVAPFVLAIGRTMERHGKMPDSLSKGRIALIPKKGDGTNFNHWRPITVLNDTYRILSGVLAKKIEPILNKNIKDEQKGFLKNRKITDISRNILTVIESFRENKKFGALIAIDFKKAFDSVKHCQILRSIKKLLPRSVFNPIRALLANGSS